jgi:methyl-accepting chemotaxis protein
MIQDIGICQGSGKSLCEIRIGSDKVGISKVGRLLNTLLNRRTILMAESKKEFSVKSNPVLALVVKELVKKAQVSSIQGFSMGSKNTTDLIDETMKNIKDNITPVEITLLETKPDEIEDNSCVEASTRMATRLVNYCEDMKEFSTNLAGIRHTSGVLLRTSLAPKMWGAKEVMKVINEMNLDKDEINNGFEQIEARMEHSGDQVRLIQASIGRNTGTLKPLVGKVIENFSAVKSFMSRLAQSLQGLYTIDRVFKAHTEYPATWFFDPTTYMDFNFEYNNLINNLIKTAAIESEIIEPLLLWKIKMGAN